MFKIAHLAPGPVRGNRDTGVRRENPVDAWHKCDTAMPGGRRPAGDAVARPRRRCATARGAAAASLGLYFSCSLQERTATCRRLARPM